MVILAVVGHLPGFGHLHESRRKAMQLRYLERSKLFHSTIQWIIDSFSFAAIIGPCFDTFCYTCFYQEGKYNGAYEGMTRVANLPLYVTRKQ